MGAGAVTGVIGAFQKQSSLMMNGTLAFSIGLAAIFMEQMRYKTVDAEPLEESLKDSRGLAEKILGTREPFMFSNPTTGVNLE